MNPDDDSPENSVLRREFLRHTASAAGMAVVGAAVEPWEQLQSALGQRTKVDQATTDNLAAMTGSFSAMYTVSIVTAQRYDNVGRLLAETDPATRTVTPGNYHVSNWTNPYVAHRRYVYPINAGDDPQVNAGCLKGGANTRTVYYGANNSNWDSTRTTQCGLTTRFWDMANQLTTRTTDARGNTETVVNANNKTTTYAHNLRDQLTTVADPAGNVVTYTYANWDNQATSLDDPDLGTITYTYDLHGRLDTQTDARGVTLDIDWDKANRPTDLKRNGAAVSSWAYDPTNGAGLLDNEQHWNRDTAGTSQGWVKKTHTYNNRRQVQKTTWDVPGYSGTPVSDIEYVYRDSGAIDTITYPNGTQVKYRYNRLEQPDQVTAGGALAGRWVAYDNLGRPTQIHRGTAGTANNLITTRTYDPQTGRLADQVTTDNAGVKVQDFDYGYTADGLISDIRDRANLGGGIDQTACYTYDVLDQLLKGWTRTDHNCLNGHTDQAGPEPFWSKYTYNDIGNITNAIGNRTVGGSYTYPNPGADRPHAPTAAGSNSYTYDAAGNRKTHTVGGLTDTYVYDVQNRLLSITGTGAAAGGEFLYDTNGRRVKHSDAGVPDVFYFDNYEVDANGTTTIHIRIAGHTVAALVGTTLWTTATDHLGSAAYSASTTGTGVQRYTPYGGYRGPNTNTQPTNRSYTSQTNDNNGLYYYGARYYDPIAGRFTQPDTIVPNVADPADWNRYAYVRNSPLVHTDPSGHFACAEASVLGLIDLAYQLCQYDDDEIADAARRINSGDTIYRGHLDIYEDFFEEYEAAILVAPITPGQEVNRLLTVAGSVEPFGTIIDAFDCSFGGSSLACAAIFAPFTGGRFLEGLADQFPKFRRISPSFEVDGRNYFYGDNVINRAAEDLGPLHNFPNTYDADIISRGTRTVEPNGYTEYRLPGHVNGSAGHYEIGTMPSAFGERITHRFFRKD